MSVRLETGSAGAVWIDLLSGVRVLCRPYDAEANYAARFEARSKWEELKDDTPMNRGRMIYRRLVEIAVATVQDWEGVEDEEGKPVPYTTDALRLMFSQEPGMAEAFDYAYTERILEKKGSTKEPNGNGEAESTTARSARGSAFPARKARKGSGGRSARL